MILFTLPVLFISAFTLVNATEYLLSCKDYDWLVNNLEKSKVMSPAEQIDIKLTMMEQTDPKCFEQ